MVMANIAGRAICAALALTAGAAQAADGQGSTFQITPYLWGSGFSGTIRPLPNSPEFHVSRSLGEVLENIDAAFFVSALARRGRLVVVADLSHSAASRDGLISTPLPQAPVVPAEGSLKTTSLTALAGARAVDLPDFSIDILGGIRATWIGVTVESAALGIAASPTASVVDPVFALRFNRSLGENWSLLFYGDAGGFGAGSEFTAQLVGTVNARVAPRIWLSGGYRYLKVDYRGDVTRADIALSGPLLGATFTF